MRQKAVEYIDGTAVFHSAEDTRTEERVAERLGAHWGVQLRSFGALSEIDFYAEQHGRLVGLVEIKGARCSVTKYPSARLAVRKWLALTLAQTGLGVPATVAFAWPDGLAFIPIKNVDGRRHRIGGWSSPRRALDVTPMIEVPVSDMTHIEGPFV